MFAAGVTTQFDASHNYMGTIPRMYMKEDAASEAQRKKQHYAWELQQQIAEKQRQKQMQHVVPQETSRSGSGYTHRAPGGAAVVPQRSSSPTFPHPRQADLKDQIGTNDFFPYGRGGSGAPIRDSNGLVITRRRKAGQYNTENPDSHQILPSPQHVANYDQVSFQYQQATAGTFPAQSTHATSHSASRAPSSPTTPVVNMFTNMTVAEAAEKQRAKLALQEELREQVEAKKREQAAAKRRKQEEERQELERIQREQQELAERYEREKAQSKEQKVGPKTSNILPDPPPRQPQGRQRRQRSPPPNIPASQSLSAITSTAVTTTEPERTRASSPPIPTMRGKIQLTQTAQPAPTVPNSTLTPSVSAPSALGTTDAPNVQLPASTATAMLAEITAPAAAFMAQPMFGRRATAQTSSALDELRLQMEAGQKRMAEQLKLQEQQMQQLRELAKQTGRVRQPAPAATAVVSTDPVAVSSASSVLSAMARPDTAGTGIDFDTAQVSHSILIKPLSRTDTLKSESAFLLPSGIDEPLPPYVKMRKL